MPPAQDRTLTTVRERLESLRKAPAGPADTDFETALLAGPDPVGALTRTASLDDDALDALLGEGTTPVRRLMHQGSYPARLLSLLPEAAASFPEGLHDVPDRTTLESELRELAKSIGPANALGRIRTLEYLRIAVLEVADAPLEVVGGALSQLAAACTSFALESVDPALSERLVVFGMGKLGGNELNFLSDIDLLFCHDDTLIPPGAEGFRPRNALFAALRQVIKLLEGEGRWRPLFRVDLRLRPFGTRGPLSLSKSALLDYYERHGRPWERQLWLRASPIAGKLELGHEVMRRLDPFVYRRALSPAIFEEIGEMMRRARRETTSTMDSSYYDLKYAAGGIREVEFFVQGLQLLNGGRTPGVRSASTLGGLDRLLAHGLLSDHEHARLTSAYRWLRRVEHRVQLAEGHQTHAVPADEDARALLAARLAQPDRGADPAHRAALREAFERELTEHRDEVIAVTSTLISDATTDGPADDRNHHIALVLDPTAPREVVEEAFAALGLFDPVQAAGVLWSLRTDDNSAFCAKGAAAAGATRLLRACLDAPDPDAAMQRLAEFASRRPGHYGAWRFLAKPAQDPVVRVVAELFSSSEQLSRGLVGFPGPHGRAGDEALSTLLDARDGDLPTSAQIARTIDDALASDLTDDALDRALLLTKHREMTRIALHDLARRPMPASVGASVTALAEHTLRAIVEDLARDYARHSAAADGPPPPTFSLCVVGLGKLGMSSMDYGSDLDLVFVFEPHDCEAVLAQDAAVHVTRALRRRLEDRRHGARLFEVDMRLRPSGRQGMLVSSLDAFARYHGGKLPTWERLAALRMRPVVERRFGIETADASTTDTAANRVSRRIDEQIRPASVWPLDDLPFSQIASDVRALKSRIEVELSRETRSSALEDATPRRYNAKTGVGGALELELLVAALQLRAGRDASADDPVRGRDIWGALDGLVQHGALDPEQGARLSDAYGFLRRLQNRLRMTATRSGDDPDLFASNSPRLAPLARRMGLEDVDVLLTRFLEHRSAVRAAFDRHLS